MKSGNFDIGGSGSAGLAFTNENTNASSLLVKGNMIVRAGSTYKNYGTGTSIEGDLTVNGSIIYDAADGRNLNFIGGTAQSINGTGTLNVYNFTIGKILGELTLNRAVTIDNIATFNLGRIISSTANPLIFATTASATGMTDASFTNGPVRYLGINTFTYPVGKVDKYCPAKTGNGTGGTTIIWSEDFATGASSWTLANVLGTEGVDPNFFTVSGAEGGNVTPDLGAPGSCGVTNSNNTMHIASVFFPTSGAAYDAGGGCGFLFCPETNREAQTPNINCTGQNNVKLKFNYIEGGQLLLDNASVYYSADGGTTWSLLDDMPKTLTGCGGQGIWTSRNLSLPTSADNNPNVKLAFRWVNNDDGVGSDPSFAIDNIQVFTIGPANDFSVEYFRADPTQVFGTPVEPTIDFIETCEYWIIDRLQGLNAREVTLFGTSNSCAQPTVCNGVARWSGSIWENKGLGNYPCSSVGGLSPVQSALAIPNFSPFALISILVPLPIELIEFTAKQGIRQTVDCNWSSASESDNDYFEIQHSEDAVNFKTFNKIQGAGNSNSKLKYSATHQNPVSGNNYYRLKQVDFNGKANYSDLRIVDFDAEQLSLFPNPANAQLFFSDKNEIAAYQIYSADGKLISSKVLEEKTTEGIINIEDFDNGMYTLKFTYASGKTESKQVIKN